jgi:hypothetical protein
MSLLDVHDLTVGRSASAQQTGGSDADAGSSAEVSAWPADAGSSAEVSAWPADAGSSAEVSAWPADAGSSAEVSAWPVTSRRRGPIRDLFGARTILGRYRRKIRDEFGETVRRLRLAAAPLVCIFRRDEHNIGDIMSAPRNYFGFLRQAAHVEIRDYLQKDPDISNKVAVIGGGGIFVFREEMARVAASRGSTLICWGVGHNTHGADRIDRIDLLERFALVGLRDYGYTFGHEWVPCVSCMTPIFDRPFAIEHDVVIYEHHEFGFGDADPSIPRLSNDCMDFDKVIAFLGSAETVVTTSYHGAYWATLLGRKAVVADPFSSKFQGYKHRPAFCTSADWREALPRARAYPEALAECREANVAFADKVAEVVDQHTRRPWRTGGRRKKVIVPTART